MSTHALDVATIMHALQTLEREHLGENRQWNVYNGAQKRLFELYAKYKTEIDRLRNLKAKASTDWEVLNRFLTEHKFDPMFSGPLNGIGVVSILDQFVKWLQTGQVGSITAVNRQTYPAFEFPSQRNVIVYRVKGYSQPLAMLKTQSGDNLYLMMADWDWTGMDMVEMVFDVISQHWSIDKKFEGVRVPKVDFNIKPDISWLCGADTTTESGGWMFIAEAMQQFMFRMNEKGARAKVATGIIMRGMAHGKPQRLVFDRPFYGFFLQKNSKLPLAIFYADYDSWKEPAGSLEDL